MEKDRGIDHLHRGQRWALKRHIDSFEGDAAQRLATHAHRSDSFGRDVRAIVQIRGLQERIPLEPARVIVKQIKDSGARSRNNFVDFRMWQASIVILIGEVFVSEFGREQLDGALDQHNESPQTDGCFDSKKFDGQIPRVPVEEK